MVEKIIPSGKGMFIWKIKYAGDEEAAVKANGTADQVIYKCVKYYIPYIVVKVLNGQWKYNQRPIAWDNNGNVIKYADDILKPWVHALQEVGIKVYGFQYVYLDYPEDEGKAALERVQSLGLDGLYIDAEGEARKNAKNTAKYCKQLLNAPFSISLCSYRYPLTMQPDLDWKTFLNICDFVSPQVYWEGSHNPDYQLKRSYSEYRQICDLPFIPVGSAYMRSKEWWATRTDIINFMNTAIELGLPGVSFWEWSNIQRYLPENFEAIQTYDWKNGDPGQPENPEEPTDNEKLNILWREAVSHGWDLSLPVDKGES